MNSWASCLKLNRNSIFILVSVVCLLWTAAIIHHPFFARGDDQLSKSEHVAERQLKELPFVRKLGGSDFIRDTDSRQTNAVNTTSHRDSRKIKWGMKPEVNSDEFQDMQTDEDTEPEESEGQGASGTYSSDGTLGTGGVVQLRFNKQGWPWSDLLGRFAPPLKAALLITGRIANFAFGNKARHVVGRNVRAGHTVDVFALLADGGYDCKSTWGKTLYNPLATNWSTLEADFGDRVQKAGGRLFYRVREQLDLEPLSEAKFTQWNTPEMVNQKCGALQNLYHRFEGMSMIAEQEILQGWFYDLIIVSREDGFWLGPLKLENIRRKMVSSKNCTSWGGLNDKVFVIPRVFAHRWLNAFGMAYTNKYVDPKKKMENPEQLYRAMGRREKIPTFKVPAETLPVTDVRLVKTTMRENEEGVLRLHQDPNSGCFPSSYAGIDSNFSCVPAIVRDSVLKRLCEDDPTGIREHMARREAQLKRREAARWAVSAIVEGI